MPQIVLKHPGQTVAEFSFTGSVVTVAGVVVDCAARQRDTAVTVEVRADQAGAIEGGNGAYLAQIAIPARRYLASEPSENVDTGSGGQPGTTLEPVPLDPNAVQVTLWPAA